MPSESELREILRGGGSSAPDGIDLAAVLGRARARRRPKVILASAVGALALVGVLVPVGVVALGTPGSDVLNIAVGGADDSGATTEDGTPPQQPAPADRLNLCEGTLAEVAPAGNGLVLEVSPVVADSGADHIPVTVTLRNTGSEVVRGTTGGSPALTLSRDGLVLWHSNGPTTMIAVIVDLQPGETLSYIAELKPVVCGVQDDLSGFRDDLPAAVPGFYLLGAAIDFTIEAGSAPILVTGPASIVELR